MLHGRDAELDLLRARLRGARDGRSFALAVVGEPGIGKTTLVQTAIGEADGLRVLRVRGYESEAEIPYAALLEVVQPLLHLAEGLPEQQRAALRSALALGPAAEHSRFAVPVAVLALLGAAAEEGPLLVVVDDAHWCDAASREALLFAARRLRAEGVGVLLTVRTGGPQVDVAGLEVLELEGLGPAGARALLADRVAPSVADALAGATGGNPLALLELPEILSEDERRGLRPITTPLPAGELVAQLFSARIAALPAPTRRALGAAAALDEGRLDELFGALRRLGLSEADLAPAEQAGVVTVRGVRFAFQHPLVRSAAYQGQTVVERYAAHAALAEATPDARAAAWHRAQAAAGPDEAVAGALADAAADALRRGGRAEAARTFARAAELTPDPRLAARRRVDAAAAAHDAGDDPRALALLDAAEAGSLDDGDLTVARRLRALVAVRHGDGETGVRLLEEEAARIAPVDPVGAGRALLMTAPAHMHNGDFLAMLDVAGRARRLVAAGAGGDPVAAIVADDLSALSGCALGRTTPASIGALDAASTRDVTSGLGEVVIASVEGLALYERPARALELFDGHVAHARAEGAVLMLLYALAARARAHHRTGRWPAARADAEEAVELHRGVGQDTIFSGYVLAVAAIAAMDAGDLDVAREHAEASLASATRSGAQTILLWTHWARGRLALLDGRPDEAIAALTELERVAARVQWGNPQIAEPRADLADALHRTGDLAALGELGQRLRRESSPDYHLPLAIAGRIEGLAASGDAFEAPLAAALAEHDAVEAPFERARTLLALGTLRDGADARAPLQEALDVFERLGAAPWAQLARQALRVPARSSGAPVDAAQTLTAQEWRVAELVAEGLTNREVGAALFLSPKTIEHHLSAVYRKLGVRSRTQLGSALAR